MRKSVSILIIAIITFACKSEQSRLLSDLQQANLKGKIRSIDKTNHETGNTCGCVLKTDCNQSRFIYNEKGNLLAWYTIDENGIINDSTNFKYNRHGVCSEIKMFSKRKPAGRQVPVFNGEKVSGYKIYSKNGVLESTLNYAYSGNEITEEKTLDEKGVVTGSIQKEYSDGLLVAKIEKGSNGEVKSTSRYKRNANKDILECLTIITKDNKEFKLTYEYEYDKEGNWIKQTQFYDGAIINIIIRNIEYFKS